MEMKALVASSRLTVFLPLVALCALSIVLLTVPVQAGTIGEVGQAACLIG